MEALALRTHRPLRAPWLGRVAYDGGLALQAEAARGEKTLYNAMYQGDPYFQGEDEHYVMTPTFQVVKVEGTGESLTSYVKARYPDGSDWYIVTFSTFKEGKILKRVDFYAPFYQAPAWRAKWVEKF